MPTTRTTTTTTHEDRGGFPLPVGYLNPISKAIVLHITWPSNFRAGSDANAFLVLYGFLVCHAYPANEAEIIHCVTGPTNVWWREVVGAPRLCSFMGFEF